MEESYSFLKFHLKILKLLHLWPKTDSVLAVDDKANDRKSLCNYFFIIFLLPTSIPLGYDMIAILSSGNVDISTLCQPMLAFVCIFVEHYMGVCFILKRTKVLKLLSKMLTFEKYSSISELIYVDKKGTFYSKLLLLYSTIGASTYVLMPLVTIDNCNKSKPEEMLRAGIPCGMVARERLPIRYDYFPFFEIMYLHQVYLVFTITLVIVTLTMLLCSILMHATHHLKKLRLLILKTGDCPNKEESAANINYCVVYHIHIISFCDDINEAFGSQMLLHITLTSFVISILGFQLLVVQALDFLRYFLHLLGWLSLLLLVCYYGQTLIDESEGVAIDAYNCKWYKCCPRIRDHLRLIIRRGQKPLTLKALNVGFLSLMTFLRIMSSAYSYFTLLINLK